MVRIPEGLGHPLTGKRWAETFQAQLNRTSVMLVLLGAQSIGGGWLRHELQLAKNRGIFAQTVLLDAAEAVSQDPVNDPPPLRLRSSAWSEDVTRIIDAITPWIALPERRQRVVMIVTVGSDLDEERKVVADGLEDRGWSVVEPTDDEDALSQPWLIRLREASALVLLAGARADNVVRRSGSPVRLLAEQCYEAARAANVPVLAFFRTLITVRSPSLEQSRLSTLRTRLSAEVTPGLFDSAMELRRMVSESLLRLQSGQPSARRALLFVGHTIDRPGRTEPRFPSQYEDIAARAIARAVHTEVEGGTGPVAYAAASGSHGGDILFLEACRAAGLTTRIYLPNEPSEFMRRDDESAGGGWAARLAALLGQSDVHALHSDEPSPGASEWERNAEVMLQDALTAHGPQGVTLIALWDGQPTESPGGPTYLIARAHTYGIRAVRLNTRELFRL